MSYAQPPLPLPKPQYEAWTSAIERSIRRRDEKIAAWKVQENLDRYETKKTDGQVNDGSDFADVERKKAGLFYDTPFVTVVPDPEGNSTIATLHQELLNTMLDEPIVHAKATALKAIQACLVAIQPSPTKIGYVPTIAMGTAPGPMGVPVQAPQVVHEEFFWSKISERSLLLPDELKDTDYDRSAAWLGYQWRMPASQVRRTYNLPPDFVLPAASGEHTLTFTDDQHQPGEDADDPQVTGVYLEYKAVVKDPAVSHPGLIRCLVLVDGLETPIKHEDAPWLLHPVTKQFDPRSGFTGFSIHPLALRDLTDSAYVPSDCTITAGLTQEIGDYLTDMKRQRESNRLAVVYDPQQLPTDTVTRIEAGKVPAWIPTKPGSLAQGKDAIMAQIANLGSGREHYLGLEIFQGKRERVLGISANTVGAEDDSTKTATEITEVNRNTEARFEQERQRAVGTWYLSGVRKLSALLVRYGDRFALEILGQMRGQQWIQARNQGWLGRFTFTVQIDGGKYMDVEADRRAHANLYNLTAKDPNANRVPLLKKMAPLWGLDAAEWVVEQVPEPKPEPPKINFSVAAADLNPVLPQFPFVVSVLRQGGIDIGVTDVMLAQLQAQALAGVGRSPTTAEQETTSTPNPNDPMGGTVETPSGPSQVPTAGVGPHPKAQGAEHQGAADTADRINQHALALTGERSGPPTNA